MPALPPLPIPVEPAAGRRRRARGWLAVAALAALAVACALPPGRRDEAGGGEATRPTPTRPTGPVTVALPGPPADAYRTERVPPPTAGLAALVARRLPALGHDPCLERAAAAYANVDPGLAPSLPAAFVEHVLHWAGCPDPSASVFAQTTDGDDPADFVDWLATELAGTDATAVGVVGVELGASAGWRRVGFVVARRFELRPVPSSGEPGTALALQLKVDPAYAAARVHVTQPRGQTRELPVGLGGGWAVASVPLAEEKGRQWVEVMAEAARGPEVLALFPVEVGRPLSHLWVGEAKADESGISTGAAAEELIGRLLARERGRFELPPLERDERLDAVARAYSQEMAETGEIAHVSVASGSIADRLAAAGYEFRFAAENLARGASLVDAHEGLLRSPGHRAAMLEPAVSRLGVGVARGRSPGGGPMWFVTQIFVRPFEARDPG